MNGVWEGLVLKCVVWKAGCLGTCLCGGAWARACGGAGARNAVDARYMQCRRVHCDCCVPGGTALCGGIRVATSTAPHIHVLPQLPVLCAHVRSPRHPPPRPPGVHGAVQHGRQRAGGGAHRQRQDHLRRVCHPAHAAARQRGQVRCALRLCGASGAGGPWCMLLARCCACSLVGREAWASLHF
jgi:hypothetical protein